ncbi:MAG TPA: mechanosensitive ion channel family protein [Thermoanaerobaculia bacterium]|nr:mechanosensitive ion channel family protein [Thermoanaerobaculia bacterium]
MPRRRVDFARVYFPLTLAIILFAVFLPFRLKPIDVPGFGDMHAYLEFAAYAALIFLLVRLLDTFVFDFVLRRQVAAPQILRGLISIVLYAILFASAFSTIFNYKVGTLLTGGALLAAVLGLALQDTLGNLFSGIALHMEETYEIGDVVHTGDYMGVVEGVSWRATRLRGFNNQLVVVPNSVIARERLEVFPRNNLNARIISVGIDYNAAPATVIGILTQVATHVEGVARERPCLARVSSFGDSAVIYDIKYFTRDYSGRDRIDADIRKAVWYALRRNGISIPFPIRSFQPYLPPTSEQVTPEEIFQRLRAVDVLEPISDQGLQSVVAAVKMHFYSKGEAILRHGTSGDSMFVVHVGSVAIRVPDDSLTGWHQVAELGPGTVFGEMALLTGEMRTADVVAMTDVVALEIGKESLHPIMAVHPDLAGAISHQIMLRREHLESLRAADREQEELTLMSRIRSYFGL